MSEATREAGTREAGKGERQPSRRARVVVALAIGVCSVGFLLLYRMHSARPSDFDQVWFGARAIWSGRNPYDLVGPGREFQWDWPLYYPATALVLVSPLALLPVALARSLFVGLSAAMLAYGVTRTSWVRLPLFGSCAFMVAAVAAQWSPLMTAALCMPALAWIVSAKPNIGFALLAADPSAKTIGSAALGAIVLALIGLLLLPSWPGNWMVITRAAPHFTVPLLHRGGFLLALVLLRWRRPEARLLAALAVMPQNMVIYATLPLFLIPRTFRQTLLLVALNNLAFIAGLLLISPHPRSVAENYYGGDLLVALCYIPALVMVLMRPNEGSLPSWIVRAIPRVSAKAESESLRTG